MEDMRNVMMERFLNSLSIPSLARPVIEANPTPAYSKKTIVERYSNGDIKETWYFPPSSKETGLVTPPTANPSPTYHNDGEAHESVNKYTFNQGQMMNTPNQSPKENALPWSRPEYTTDQDQDSDDLNIQNRSVFMTNLPAHCTYTILFNGIRRVGNIAHARIHPSQDRKTTSSAEIEFFDSTSVEKLFTQLRAGNLRIGFRTPFIHLNHTSIPPLPRSCGLSRVLQVAGPANIVSGAHFGALFTSVGLLFDIEGVRTLWEYPDVRCVEFRFSSYRTQAQHAVAILEEQKRRMGGGDWERVVVKFGPDPCSA